MGDVREELNRLADVLDETVGERGADRVALRNAARDLRALAAAPQPAGEDDTQADRTEREMGQLIDERDRAEDALNKVLDLVLGPERDEWSSAYNYDDAVSDVEDRMAELADTFTAPPEPAPSAPLLEDWLEAIERMLWLADNGERPNRGEVHDVECAIAGIKAMIKDSLSDVTYASLGDALSLDGAAGRSASRAPAGAEALAKPMTLEVAFDFADNPRPYHSLACQADTNGELYRALKVLAAEARRLSGAQQANYSENPKSSFSDGAQQAGLAAQVIALADERKAGYAAREHGAVVNGRVADKIVALADGLMAQQAAKDGAE